MLTASLQSTWEAQRSKQRPKYGNPYQSGPTYEDVENNNKHAIDDKKLPATQTAQPHSYARFGESSGTGNYSSELPNLKMPQVKEQSVCLFFALFLTFLFKF